MFDETRDNGFAARPRHVRQSKEQHASSRQTNDLIHFEKFIGLAKEDLRRFGVSCHVRGLVHRVRLEREVANLSAVDMSSRIDAEQTHQGVDLNNEPLLHLVQDLGIGTASNERDGEALGAETARTTDLSERTTKSGHVDARNPKQYQPGEGKSRLHRAYRS